MDCETSETNGAGPSRKPENEEQPKETPPRKPRNSRPAFSFANWPTIKIIRPPPNADKNHHRTDERCIIYCTQSVGGRSTHRAPKCHSFCLRRVFAHEVRSILSNAESRSGEGHIYPLPPAFQSLAPSEKSPQGEDDVRYWQEGWYAWLGRNRNTAIEQIVLMQEELKAQGAFFQRKKELLDEVRRRRGQKNPPTAAMQGPVQRPITQPIPGDFAASSTLVHLRSSLLMMTPVFEPTLKLLNIVHTSITSGAQGQFLERLWRTAWSKDPWILARNACRSAWKAWSEDPPDKGKSSKA